jgi:drug/metabolite transporter (DMT)-like permease
VGGPAAGLPGANDLYGLALALAAGLSYSGMLICLRRAAHQGGDVPQALLLVQAPVAIALLAGLGFAEGSLPVRLNAEQHFWLALMGIGAQTLAWSAITYGLARVPAHHGAMILVLQPVGSLVLGWLLLEQALTLGRIAGAVLVLAAIALTVLGDRLPGLRLASDQATRATTT